MRPIGNIARGLALATALGAAITPSLCRAADDDIKALAKAYNGFGQDVFTVLERKPGNIVFSPYSVGVAMAMTLSGARGDTQSEMLSAMRFTQTPAEIEGANAPLAAGLRSYAKQLPAQPSPKEICAKMNMSQPGCINAVSAAWKSPAAPTQLEIANALMITPWGAVTRSVSGPYVSLLHKQYDAELFRNASLKDVNDWARKTNRKIDPLLQELPRDVIAVILNAVYFNGTWEAPFESKLTKDAPFTLGSGEVIQTATMEIHRSFAFHEDEGFTAVRLPYQTPELGMIVVLPDDAKGLAKVAAKLDADGLPILLDEMGQARPALLDLKLPRFKMQYGASLKEPMQLAGVRLAFDDKEANFDGMAGTRLRPGEICIAEIIHKATIEVTEEGPVASAATAVMPTRTSAPPQPKPFAVDHPFLFYIVDRASGAVLFQGRIEDPRQSTAS